MEVPDVLVVNKADQAELAKRAMAELRAALASLHRAGIRGREQQETPLLATSALDGTGVPELWRALEAHREGWRRRALWRQGAARDDRLGARAFVRRHGRSGSSASGERTRSSRPSPGASTREKRSRRSSRASFLTRPPERSEGTPGGTRRILRRCAPRDDDPLSADGGEVRRAEGGADLAFSAGSPPR